MTTWLSSSSRRAYIAELGALVRRGRIEGTAAIATTTTIIIRDTSKGAHVAKYARRWLVRSPPPPRAPPPIGAGRLRVMQGRRDDHHASGAGERLLC